MYNTNALKEKSNYASAVITRYVLMAIAGGVDSTHRRFAIERWKHRKKGTQGTLTVEEWEEMLRVHGGCCPFCGEPTILTVEHLVPKSLGGGFSKENILPACEFCNSARGKIFSVSTKLLFALEFSLYSADNKSRTLRMADPVRLTWFDEWAQLV